MKLKSICAIKNIFDIECAGCGGTRMFLAILKFDFYQAFRYNPLLFVLFIIGVVYFIYNVILKLIGKKLYIPSFKWLYVLFIVALSFMILRNLEGFEFLLPTEV